jgi:fibronectin-binding autotransporter adhesin
LSKIKIQFSGIVIFSLVVSQCGLIPHIPFAQAATNIGTDISTDGNLTVNGALKFVTGAVGNYILTTDASGNATWSSIGSALSHATADDLPTGATNTYYDSNDVDSRTLNQLNLQKGIANGIATLNASGQIPGNQIPSLAINNTFVVANITARDALTPNTGDVAIVTDTGSGESRSYIWDGSLWIELLTPLQLYLAGSNNLSDLSNPVAARTNLSLGTGDSPTFTGLTLSGLTPGSLLFSGAGGVAEQDNANLFWDNAAKRLGINTNAPLYALDVNGDIKAGDGSLVIFGSKIDPDPTGVNGATYYNTTDNKFRCYEGGTWKDCITSIGSAELSSVAAATGANSINNGDNSQAWNWSLNTADKKGFTFSENVASTATGAPAILQASTLTGSTAMPLSVENLGDGNSFRVNDSSGDMTPFLIDDDGNVAIGSDAFDPVNPERLKVDSGSTPSFNIITATGNLDNYLQINVKNRNSGHSASSDLVATADNGNETTNYIDMGINSSGYNVPAYSIAGPNDGYIFMQGLDAPTPGGNLAVGTGTAGKAVKFYTGGATAANERMRIDGNGNVGIATTSPGAQLDVKGTIRLSGATSGYVGFSPAADAGSTTYTFPNADGSPGQALVTNGLGQLSWVSASSNWQRVGTELSPLIPGDDISTTGNISSTATGTITSSGLLSGNAGLTVTGGDTNINTNGNFNTYINAGTSTGTVNIGNPSAGAVVLESATTVSLQGGATKITAPSGDITFQPSGTGVSGLVKIGEGGLGSTTPDLLALDVKSDAGDPASGTNGSMYYNSVLNKVRCYINGTWGDCASVALSTISNALVPNSLNNGDNAQTWNWNLTNNNKAGISLGENTASTGTGTSILKTGALASSTATPLLIENLGNGNSFRINDSSGDTTPFLINNEGDVVVGSDFFDPINPEKFKVEAGVTSSSSIIAGYGDRNGPLYLNVQNRNAGTTASTSMAATADDGDMSVNYVSMGITSSGFNDPSFTAAGPHDAYFFNVGDFSGSQGGNMLIGTIEPGMSIKFYTGGGASEGNEQMRINSDGNVGIGTTSAGSKLDVKGALRLSGSTSGYVGFAPAAAAGSTTYTLPSADGAGNQVLSTNGSGILSWIDQTGVWQRVGTLLSPITAGDNVTTSGAISTTGTGTITSAGLLTGTSGAAISGAATAVNDNSNFDTKINTGTSMGAVTIGNGAAGAINVTSGAAIGITSGTSLSLTGGTSSSLNTTTGDVTIQPAGTGTTANLKIGAGGAGSLTPDLLALDVKSTTGDPLTGDDGAMYYNKFTNKFRCHVNGSWGDCDTTGGTLTLQGAYNGGAAINTAGTNIAFTLNATDQFTAAGAGSVNLTPTGASNFTSGGALTLTGGGASTWSTSSGALTLTSSAAATWGTSAGDLTLQAAGAGAAANIKIGTGGAGSTTPDLFGIDVKSTSGDPVGGYNGAMYYNAPDAVFRCYEAGGWKNCGSSAASATTLQQAYVAGPTITTTGSNVALVLTSGNFTASGAGAVNLTPTGASSFTSGGALALTGGAASTWGTSAGDLTLQAAGTGTSANVKIGVGGAGSTTPDILGLDVKSDAGDPAGFNGATYYNGSINKFRCYESGQWKDCDEAASGPDTFQSVYGGGSTISTTGNNIAYTLNTTDQFTVTGAGSVNLTPTGASSFTSGGALTLTGGAASTWGTSAGNLTLQAAGTGTSAKVQIGVGGAGSITPDTLVLDVKSDAGDPAGTNGAMYYNAITNKLRCYESGAWRDCYAGIDKSTGTAKGDLIAYTAINAPVRLPIGGTNGWILTIDSTQATGMKWAANVIAPDSLDFTELSDAMTVDANTSINLAGKSFTINDLTGGGALGISTNAAALTLTAGAASSWTTTAGALTIDAGTVTPAALNLGTTGANAITIGKAGLTATSIGPVQTGNAANAGSLKIADGSTNFITLTSPPIASDYTLTLPTTAGSSGQALTTNGTGTLSWSTVFVDPMTTRGDMIYRDATNATARLGRGTAGQTIKSDGTDIAWATLTGADVGLGNVTNDAQLKQSIGTAKGDLVTYTATNAPVRLPVGSNSQVLVSDSTQATGLRWSNITVGNNSIDFAQLSDAMTVDANTSINLAGKNLTISDLTGGGALAISSNAAALTLTAGAASTWSTFAGALTIDSAAALNLGTTNATSVSIGRAAGGAINLTTPTGVNLNPYGVAAGSLTEQRFLELAANGANYVAFQAPDALAANNPYTLPNAYPAASGYSLTSDTSGNLSWVNIGGVLPGWTDGGTTVNLTTATDKVFIGNSGAATAKLEVTSSDANAIRINPYGAAAGNTGTLQLMELAANGTNFVGFKAPDNIAANVSWVLPSADGTNGQLLTTNGSGVLSWQNAGAATVSSVFGRTGAVTATSTDYTTLTALTNLSSAAATALTLDSGTTGALNIGTGASSKTITVGNTTGTTGVVLASGSGGIKIGSTGTAILNHLSATASIDITGIGATSCGNTNFTVTGAAQGDTVVATPTPSGSGIENFTLVWNAYVANANAVVIRVCNTGITTQDPGAQTWRVDVWHH